MKETKNRNILITGFASLAAFAVWTVLVKFVDVRAIGPMESNVGFAELNEWVHNFTGENLALYDLTDLLSVIPLGLVGGFGVLGLTQLIKRKNLFKVDADILVLGGFYIAVLALFLLFEVCVVNYRPVLIEGVLEASYPSSTTMLSMCVLPTAAMQMNERIKNTALRRGTVWTIHAFTAFMVVSRLISGVHWFTDIIGGALLSAGLVMIYHAAVKLIKEKKK